MSFKLTTASHRAAHVPNLNRWSVLLHATTEKKHALTDLKRHPATQTEITAIFIFSLFQSSRHFSNRPAKQNSKAIPAQKEFSGFLSKQLDLLPSFSPKHTIYHLTTNYHFSHVTVACFTLCNLSLSTPNKSRQGYNWRVKPADTLQNHNGVLLLLSFFFFQSLLNMELQQQTFFFYQHVKAEWTALHWWGIREQISHIQSQQRQPHYLVSEEELH